MFLNFTFKLFVLTLVSIFNNKTLTDVLSVCLIAAEAAARGLPGPYPLPHGHPLMMAAREQELLYRDLLSRPPYSTDPILAHQVDTTSDNKHKHSCLVIIIIIQ